MELGEINHGLKAVGLICIVTNTKTTTKTNSYHQRTTLQHQLGSNTVTKARIKAKINYQHQYQN